MSATISPHQGRRAAAPHVVASRDAARRRFPFGRGTPGTDGPPKRSVPPHEPQAHASRRGAPRSPSSGPMRAHLRPSPRRPRRAHRRGRRVELDRANAGPPPSPTRVSRHRTRHAGTGAAPGVARAQRRRHQPLGHRAGAPPRGHPRMCDSGGEQRGSGGGRYRVANGGFDQRESRSGRPRAAAPSIGSHRSPTSVRLATAGAPSRSAPGRRRRAADSDSPKTRREHHPRQPASTCRRSWEHTGTAAAPGPATNRTQRPLQTSPGVPARPDHPMPPAGTAPYRRRRSSTKSHAVLRAGPDRCARQPPQTERPRPVPTEARGRRVSRRRDRTRALSAQGEERLGHARHAPTHRLAARASRPPATLRSDPRRSPQEPPREKAEQPRRARGSLRRKADRGRDCRPSPRACLQRGAADSAPVWSSPSSAGRIFDGRRRRGKARQSGVSSASAQTRSTGRPSGHAPTPRGRCRTGAPSANRAPRAKARSRSRRR